MHDNAVVFYPSKKSGKENSLLDRFAGFGITREVIENGI
jgi:hypothetical protein